MQNNLNNMTSIRIRQRCENILSELEDLHSNLHMHHDIESILNLYTELIGSDDFDLEDYLGVGCPVITGAIRALPVVIEKSIVYNKSNYDFIKAFSDFKIFVPGGLVQVAIKIKEIEEINARSPDAVVEAAEKALNHAQYKYKDVYAILEKAKIELDAREQELKDAVKNAKIARHRADARQKKLEEIETEEAQLLAKLEALKSEKENL